MRVAQVRRLRWARVPVLLLLPRADLPESPVCVFRDVSHTEEGCWVMPGRQPIMLQKIVISSQLSMSLRARTRWQKMSLTLFLHG